MVPDVEMNELMYPVLYLWKRLDDETGGPGAQRGGLGVDYAWTLWNCDEVLHTVFCPCAQVPAGGYGGGYPGGGGEQSILRETDVRDALARGAAADPATLAAARTELLELTAQGLVIRAGDVFRQRVAGGGGYGDPLLRAPAAVAADLRDGYITPRGAQDAYGVRVDPDGTVDEAATNELRRSLRAARLGKDVADIAGSFDPGPSVVGGNCRQCGTTLGENWIESTAQRERTAAEHLEGLGIRVRPNAAVRVREHLCPSCGSALDVQVLVEG
jgi:N-methylhydantoinase B